MTRNLPVLCRNCSGPVEPQADLTLQCPYCDTEDELPEDALKRAMEIKRRIAGAARSVAQLKGINAVVAPLFEKRRLFFSLVGSGFGLTLLAVVCVVFFALSSGGDAVKQGMFLALYLFVPIGFVLSVCVALTVGRWTYRRQIRSQLLARAPREPGGSFRCRACGGDLPHAQTMLIKCEYCGTHSLAAPEIVEQRIEQLRSEEESYRRRAGALVGHVSRSTMRMNRTLVICVVLTYLVMYVSLWVYSSF